MNKDLNLLKEVSKYFNEDTLKQVLSKEKSVSAESVAILGWDFGEAIAKGDNNLSVVYRVRVKSKVNGQVSETRLIIKAFPKEVGKRKTLRCDVYFHNEIVFYNEVAARFHKYLKSKGQSQLLCIPQCYATHMDGENDFIVLQDVGCMGYGPICRQDSLSYEQCKGAAETLASFHAVSFGYKNDHKQDFEKMASMLTETLYTHDIYENWYKRFYTSNILRIAKDALAKEYPGSKAEKVFNSYGPDELIDRTIELCTARGKEASSVVTQGDAWAPNFLARQAAGSEQPDVLLIDFQLARCTSPVLDIVFFIYACTDRPMREKYYDRLLNDYYRELRRSMQLLGVDLELAYPESAFRKEVKEQSVYGLTFALEALPVTMMPAEEAFNLDHVKEQKVDIAEIWKIPNIRTAENRRRHAEMIIHAVENGFI